MDTSREDVGIAIRSAFLKRGTKQRFSLLILIVISITFLFVESIQTKPLNHLRSVIKDVIYRTSSIVLYPSEGLSLFINGFKSHINLYKDYKELKAENERIKNEISQTDYLELENSQLRKLIDDQINSSASLISSRVLLDKKSPYLNSFILSSGGNKQIKNGMAVLDGANFIGRIVDTNFFSSRVLLVSDLNSKIPVVIEPSGYQAILNGRGKAKATLEYLPENHEIKNGDKIFTSGKEGIFSPGIPIGITEIETGKVSVLFFSDLSQISYVNIVLKDSHKNE